MALAPFSPFGDSLDDTPDGRRRRQQAQTGQAATNGTLTSRMGQQQAQPAGGNFQTTMPGEGTPSDRAPSRTLAERLAERRNAAPAPAANGATYQTYYGNTPTGSVPAPGPVMPAPGGWYQQNPTAAAATVPPPVAQPRQGGPQWGDWNPNATNAPAPTPAPTAPATPAPTGTNRYGNAANLDPAYIRQQVVNAFAKRGGQPPTEADIQYWVNKALNPDIYSDRQVRVGWNPYWEDRLITGSDSSDPRLAGSEGLISDPAAYGLNVGTDSLGNLIATWLEGGGVGPFPGTVPTGSGATQPVGPPIQTYTPPPTAPQVPQTPQTPSVFAPGQRVNMVAAESDPYIRQPNPPVTPTIPSPVTGPMQTFGQNFIDSPYTESTAGGDTPPAPGWVKVNGGWVPPDHPLAAGGGNGGGGNGGGGGPEQPPAPWEETRRLLDELAGMLDPNTAAMKEQQKETLLAAQEAERQARLQRAAATGTSGAGTLMEPDQFSGNLTAAYRDIDQYADEAGRANRLNLANAYQTLGSTENQYGLELQRIKQQDQQFYAQLQQQAGQFAAQLGFNYAQMSQQDKQFFEQLALQQAIAGQNANSDFLRLLLDSLR